MFNVCIPDLVAGNTVRVSLAAMNLSPPTSRMTCVPPLRLVMVKLCLGQWAAFIYVWVLSLCGQQIV